MVEVLVKDPSAKAARHVRPTASDVSNGDESLKEIAQTIAQNLTPERYNELKSFLETSNPSQDIIFKWLSQETKPKTHDGHMTVMSTAHYQALREAIAGNTFQKIEGSPWPTADLKQGGHIGQAQLIPPYLDGQGALSPEETQTWSELMWKQREQLSDLDVDVLDILSAIWLENAESPQDDALVDLDSLLELRGLSQRKNCKGQISGYRSEQRAEIFQSVVHIQNLWLNMAQVEVMVRTGGAGRPRRKRQTIQSRAFVITDRLGQLRLDGCVDVEKFLFRPGKVFGQFLFGPGRETALLSAKALQYDPYRQTWEKRLTRYFSWHWKHISVPDSEPYPYKVRTLLEAAGQELLPRFPQRTRDRLESALETLLNDQVISKWEYLDWSDSNVKRWGHLWLESVIVVQAPACIQKQLRRQQQPKPVIPLVQISVLEDFPARLRAARRKLQLSQSEVSEKFSITQAYFSKLETGKSLINDTNPTLYQQLIEWISQVEL